MKFYFGILLLVMEGVRERGEVILLRTAGKSVRSLESEMREGRRRRDAYDSWNSRVNVL